MVFRITHDASGNPLIPPPVPPLDMQAPFPTPEEWMARDKLEQERRKALDAAEIKETVPDMPAVVNPTPWKNLG